MKKLVVPKFGSDDEEAQWWYDHRAIVEANLSEAMRDGTAKRGTMQRVLQQAPEAQRIAVPAPDLERAKKLSRRKKVDYQSYILTLLHGALDREEAAQKRTARRKTA
jgi:predicted DNA binding CopG/RHH family protein